MTDSNSPFTGRITLALNVSDRKTAARWYEAHFGCRLLYDAEEMRWCEMTTPVEGATLGLSDGEPVVLGGMTPTFEVADLDGARVAMEGSGVRFDGPTQVVDGFVKLATCLDPDGHRVMLAQDLQGGEP